MDAGWISLLTVTRLDRVIVNHKFHEAQRTLEDILSGYRSGMSEDFSQRDLIAIENWAREKTEYSLDAGTQRSQHKLCYCIYRSSLRCQPKGNNFFEHGH